MKKKEKINKQEEEHLNKGVSPDRASEHKSSSKTKGKGKKSKNFLQKAPK